MTLTHPNYNIICKINCCQWNNYKRRHFKRGMLSTLKPNMQMHIILVSSNMC